jgi:hypothetical protein
MPFKQQDCPDNKWNNLYLADSDSARFQASDNRLPGGPELEQPGEDCKHQNLNGKGCHRLVDQSSHATHESENKRPNGRASAGWQLLFGDDSL